MKQITSPANDLIKSVRALSLKKHRAETGLFAAEGLQALGMAHAKGWTPQTVLLNEAVLGHPVAQAILQSLPDDRVAIVTPQILERLSSRDNPPMAIGVYEMRLVDLPPKPGGVWVTLEGIRDPGNLGTILRTADAAGAAGVVLVGQTCDPFSVEAVRASMGSLFNIPVARVTVSELGDWIGQTSITVVGTALEGAVDYRELTYPRPLLLAMGTEQSGLTSEFKSLCASLVKLPMVGGAESLNLSVATGVMLYKILQG